MTDHADTSGLSGMTRDDHDHVARMLRLAFAGTDEGVREWIKKSPADNFRVFKRDGRVCATLLHIPMGQFFGGRSVPMLGIAGVATAPEHRGTGCAKAMMRTCVRQAADNGWALSTLYASTHALYRDSGYEHAGHAFEATVPIIRMDARPAHRWHVCALSGADDPQIHACYARFAGAWEGMLDRGPYIWSRIRNFRGDVFEGFGVRRTPDSSLEGYVFLRLDRTPAGRSNMLLTDLVFTDPDAGRALIRLIADFGSMSENVAWYAGPTHPALDLLGQQRHKVELKDTWMMRIVDVRAALGMRGYSPHCRAELHLDIADDVVAHNSGRFVLRVEGGRGEVAPGGRGELCVSIRGLAALYSGYVGPRQAAMLGWASGDDRALDHAAGIFTTGTPAMTDHF